MNADTKKALTVRQQNVTSHRRTLQYNRNVKLLNNCVYFLKNRASKFMKQNVTIQKGGHNFTIRLRFSTSLCKDERGGITQDIDYLITPSLTFT